jgi:hypothetical protein
MRPNINRPIKPEEVAVIRAALERAPKETVENTAIASIDCLRAVGQCGCGCDSVDFVEHDPAHMSYPVADGIGRTTRGGEVGIIVWGRHDAITGLEVYSFDDEDDSKLPIPESIYRFEANET